MSLPPLLLDHSNLAVPNAQVGRTAVTLLVQSKARAAHCPLCNQAWLRVHSRYVRTLADLSWQGRSVHLRLQVRRFFCPDAHCRRRIFAERLPLATPFARTTARLRDLHTEIGMVLGGEAGSRLASRLAVRTSPDTLLRRIRQRPIPFGPPIRVLGVDDWAFRRGQRYGTILCDLERRRPVDLLPERSAEALSQWLRAHPEIEIITRDRADDYIKGASTGAPQAVQVADRWHLLRNLHDTLRRLVDRLQGGIRQAVATLRHATSSLASVPPTGPPDQCAEAPGPVRPTRARQRQQDRRQRRLERYTQVKELHQQGLSNRAIAEQIGMNRATVRRFVQAESFPERAPRRTARRTDAVTEFLQRRWNEGCRNAARLFTELQAQGFDGSYYMVRRRLAR